MYVIQKNGICLVWQRGVGDVYIFSRTVRLSNYESILLLHLMNSDDMILSRNKMMDIIASHMDQEYNVHERTIDVQIKRLRNKLFPNNPILARHVIRSVSGCGYQMPNLRQFP